MKDKDFPVKLVLSKNLNNTWNKYLINLNTNEIILEHSGIPLEDTDTTEYFNEVIEYQKKNYNIVEIERFI